MYGEKIKTIRELRGFSQEHMAKQLDIAQNTYSKIETNQTKLSAEMLQKIADILGVSPVDILSNQPTIVNFSSNHGTQGIAHIEHFYSFQREFVEKLVSSKDAEITNLQKIIENLLEDKKQLMELLMKNNNARD